MATRGIDLVVRAFRNGKAYRAGNVWTDGHMIYSYRMPIARRAKGSILDTIVVPSPGPSVTTSKHINILAREWPNAIREAI